MIIPSGGMILTHDTELQAGTYHLPSGLTISGDNITLKGNDAVLVGQNYHQ